MGRDTIWSLRTGPQGPMYFLQVDLIACLLLPPYDAIVVGAHQELICSSGKNPHDIIVSVDAITDTFRAQLFKPLGVSQSSQVDNGD